MLLLTQKKSYASIIPKKIYASINPEKNLCFLINPRGWVVGMYYYYKMISVNKKMISSAKDDISKQQAVQ